MNHNLGSVCVGTSADTPQFAVDAIAQWWSTEGSQLFPTASKILILADAGGSNGCRPHLWKQQLQEQLADRLGLEVTVCHYPTGTSKWNPVEHRLLSQISRNWAGQPLRSLDTMLNYIRGTSTATGLRVRAWLNPKTYPTKVKVSDADMKSLHLQRLPTCPAWSYTIQPQLCPGGP